MKCLVSVILIENIQYGNPKESNPTRLNRGEQDVKLIMDQLNCFEAFKQVRPDLINLTMMGVAPDDIATALLSALVTGKEHINDFVCNRLMQTPAKFHDSIKKKTGPILFLQFMK